MGVLLRVHLVASLCGWAAFPFVGSALAGLPGAGWAAARGVGLVVATLVAFAAVHLGGAPLSTAAALLSAGVVAALAFAARRFLPAAPPPPRGPRVARFAAAEALFLAATLACHAVATRNPAVDPDSERFMDYAFLQASLRAPGLPLEDPWLAGESVHYYHFGYAVAAWMTRAAATDAASAFVPILAVLHGMVWSAAFGLGAALCGRALGGAGAAFLVLGAGNWEWLAQWLKDGRLLPFDWFSPARAIAGAITEFPWFSLLWGDLHPYVVALPLFLAALAFPLAEALAPREPVPRRGGTPARAAGFAVIAGGVAATHPWDAPVLAGAAAAILLAADRRRLGRALGFAAAGAGGALLFLPFLAGLAQGERRLGLVGPPSDPRSWLLAYAPFVLLAPIWLLARPARGARRSVAAALAITGAAVALASEIFYVRDFFAATDLFRMNTVFKLYRLAWTLASIAAPFILLEAMRRAPRAGAAAAILFFGGAAVYPVLGTASWAAGRSPAPGADAAALFRALHPGDAAAAAHIAARARPGDVILEESGDPYSWSARVSTFSGVPAVLGWGNHEAGWRDDWSPVLERRAAIDALYRDPEGEAGRALLRRFRVRWIVVGEREKERYGPGTASRFAAIADVSHDAFGTTVFRLEGP